MLGLMACRLALASTLTDVAGFCPKPNDAQDSMMAGKFTLGFSIFGMFVTRLDRL